MPFSTQIYSFSHSLNLRLKALLHCISSNICPLVDKFFIYAVLTQILSAMITALFPPTILNLKAESANFFAFRMYAQWILWKPARRDLLPARPTPSPSHPRLHKPVGGCWTGQSQSPERSPEKRWRWRQKWAIGWNQDEDPIDEGGIDSIGQPAGLCRLKNNKFASGPWKGWVKTKSWQSWEHSCKWDGNPVDVSLDQVALRGHRLAQVLQVLEHLRLGPRCPLEVLELGCSTKPLFPNIREAPVRLARTLFGHCP